MERIIKGLGFTSKEEWYQLISNVDISTNDKLKAFEKWKNKDGSKYGLLKLKRINITQHV